eukprot:s5826_g2.t1
MTWTGTSPGPSNDLAESYRRKRSMTFRTCCLCQTLRGMLAAPGYADKPVRGLATKGGGGRNKRKVMRADARDRIEETPVEEQVAESEEEAAVEEDDEEAYWRELIDGEGCESELAHGSILSR